MLRSKPIGPANPVCCCQWARTGCLRADAIKRRGLALRWGWTGAFFGCRVSPCSHTVRLRHHGGEKVSDLNLAEAGRSWVGCKAWGFGPSIHALGPSWAENNTHQALGRCRRIWLGANMYSALCSRARQPAATAHAHPFRPISTAMPHSLTSFVTVSSICLSVRPVAVMVSSSSGSGDALGARTF